MFAIGQWNCVKLNDWMNCATCVILKLYAKMFKIEIVILHGEIGGIQSNWYVDELFYFHLG